MTVILKRPEVSRYNNPDHLSFHEGALVICTEHQTVIDAPSMSSLHRCGGAGNGVWTVVAK
jgi:LmbE family N-acetylglucosaminyl deacetylase